VRFEASAPGKLNLLFRVGDNREDGYHEVFSVYQAVTLRERVTVQKASQLEISVSGSIAQEQLALVPTDRSNLVVRAATELALFYPSSTRAAEQLRFEIVKAIPVLGGMAGGSADAAAALVALAGLWQLELKEWELEAIGARLGSDVPFAILGGTAIGQGRGEKLTRLESHPYHWVLVFSSKGLSTPRVFQQLDNLRSQRPSDPAADRTSVTAETVRKIRESLTSGDPSKLVSWLENDLQAPALELLPQLRETLQLAQSLGALHAQLSGSGPTIFLLAEGEDHANWLVEALTERQHIAVAAVGNAAGAKLD
jgi:4-diphosphocytidyl-2-C-methyl-D-erythritol kinase